MGGWVGGWVGERRRTELAHLVGPAEAGGVSHFGKGLVLDAVAGDSHIILRKVTQHSAGAVAHL